MLKGEEWANARVEGPITHHLRDFVPNMEKYEVVQILPM